MKAELLYGTSEQTVELIIIFALLSWTPVALAVDTAATSNTASVDVPRVSRPPTLEDFLGMEPNEAMQGGLAKVEGFVQQTPRNGEPSTQRTQIYLGYDDRNLYIVFVCFDSEPGGIRARMVRRESILGDDNVGVILDTFHDKRRAYAFSTNPFGIQADSLQTEGQGVDLSFDTLWYSRGQVTSQGYVVWMAIPFKSLRFPSTREQTWGIIFNREIPRLNEDAYWPHVSSRIEGRLNQAAVLTGLENISPGRNIQLIPFGVFRSFRALDLRDPNRPGFQREPADSDAGLDAKFIFKNSLVLDVALNPDFSQVESDEPQVTVNQRFEVFFPEKRPFFLENAGYFETPVNLVFTRRIADPQFGVRLTSKAGPWALGAFVIDDQSPGESVPSGDPFEDKRALAAILRVNRDLGKQSTLGFIFTDREFENSFNRVEGIDGRFKLSQNWVLSFQGVTSSTRCLPLAVFNRLAEGVRPRIDGCFSSDQGEYAGPGYAAEINRAARQLFYKFEYDDRARGFRTAPGFLRRPDIRRFGQTVDYRFRPEGKRLISWGPSFKTEAVFDHSGTRLDLTQDTSISWEFVRRTEVRLFYDWDRERFRLQDFSPLPENRDFSRNREGFFWTTSYIPQVTVRGNISWGTRVNAVPPAGQEPVLADMNTAVLLTTLRLLTALRIDNNYTVFRLRDRGTGANIFTNHIMRTKWNYQFTRELSLRVILQYEAVLANRALTSLDTTKKVNADLLIAYLVNPGTAFYIGYNGNAQNIFLCEGPGIAGEDCPVLPPNRSVLIHPSNRFLNDAGHFFVKVSYLLRF